MSSLGELFDVGPTHDLIGHLLGCDPRGAFTFSEIPHGKMVSRPSLWAAHGSEQVAPCTAPTHSGIGVRGRETEQKKIWDSASTLFWAKNLRWTSQRLQTPTLKSKAMGGNAFASLGYDKEVMKELAMLWGNSTFGFITRWWQGQKTQLGRSQMRIHALKVMKIPDFHQFVESNDDETLRELVHEPYKRLKDKCLGVAAAAWQDPVRNEIDVAVAKILGIWEDGKRADDLRKLQRLWCQEPNVHGNTRTLVKALRAG